MAKKMAVRNRADVKKDKRFNFPNLTGDNQYLKMASFALLISLVLLALTFGYSFSKRALVKKWPVINVAINDNLTQVDLKKIAEILKEKQFSYLLDVDLDELQKQIKQVDWVSDVKVKKLWPDTLELVIDEYKPLLAVNDKALVESGALIVPLHGVEALKIGSINLKDNTIVEKKQFLKIADEFSTLEKELSKGELKLSSIEIDKNSAWTVISEENIRIKVGRNNRFKRIERLNQLVPFLENIDEIESIDLRYSNGASIGFKKEKFKQEKLKPKKLLG